MWNSLNGIGRYPALTGGMESRNGSGVGADRVSGAETGPSSLLYDFCSHPRNPKNWHWE